MTASLAFLAAVAVVGQTPASRNYTQADGLGSDFVNRIVRDSRGLMWFCTGEGLSRFDGYEFKTYTQADGLPHRDVTSLLELPEGIFLVGTGDGVTVFDPRGFRTAIYGDVSARPMFRPVRVNQLSRSAGSFTVNELIRTRDGRVLTATSAGLFSFHTDAVAEWLEDAGPAEWREGKVEIGSAMDDSRGALWMTTDSGLWLFDSATARLSKVSGDSFTRLIEDRHGRIWAGAGDNPTGVSVFEYPAGGGLPILRRRFTSSDGLSDDRWVHSMLETSDGRILAGIRDGVNEFVTDAKTGEPSFRRIFEIDVVSLAEDVAGNIWAGTATRGAFKLTRRGFVFYDLPEKKPYATATSLFADSDGAIYATSSSSDLLRFDGVGFVELIPSGVKPRTWGWNQLDFRSRIDGEWWIPTSEGLFVYPSGQFGSLADNPPLRVLSVRDGLPSNDIFRLFEDSRGDVWTGTLNSGGIARWNRSTGKIETFGVSDGLPANNTPTAFGEDPNGNVWVGFYGGGVARQRNGVFEFFPPQSRFPSGLVNAFLADREGRLWIAVSNSGLIRVEEFAADEPRFAVLSVAEGLSSSQANCLAEDALGRIYVGTARGISRVDPATGKIRIFSHADGLPGGNVGRCASDGRGGIWFSQRFKLARLDPVDEQVGSAPLIFISDLHANGRELRRLSEVGETVVQGLQLDSGQRQIQIGFFSIGFAMGESLRFQYRVENGEWSEPFAERKLNLDLAPGNYRLEIRAVDSSGVVSPQPAFVRFSISPPFWRSWWFVAIVATIAALIIYSFSRVRLRRLLELERIRTRIAAELHDEIGSGLSQISILSEVARRGADSAKIHEPLDTIAETSRELVDAMSDIVWAINPAKDSLGDLINRIRRFANDVWEAKDIEALFDLPDNAPEITLSADLKREIYLMLRESVNNVAKHSGATKAELRIKLGGGKIEIAVADDGCGFDGLQEAGLELTAGGNGLDGMRRRAETLGGRFAVESTPGQGTTVKIGIPLAR